jgi:myosin heavy subunit
VYDFIENFRSQKLDQSSRKLQCVSRGFVARRRFFLALERIILLQAFSRRFLVRKELEVKSHGASVIQSAYRCKISRRKLLARKKEKIRELEERMRKVSIADKLEPREATDAGGEKVTPHCALEEVPAKPEKVRSNVTDLNSEIQRIKAELTALTKEALASKARIAELEAENKNLKRQIKQRMSDGAYKGKNALQYEDQPDLHKVAEGMHGLTYRSRQSKSDLDALVKMLEILK